MMQLHRLFASLLITCLLVAMPVAADDGNSDLRRAGGEAQFRVIDRFPDRRPALVEFPAIDASSPFHPIVEVVRQQRWSRAMSMLGDREVVSLLEESPPKRFLAGYIALQSDRPEEALQHFQAIDGGLEILADYLSFYSAKAALRAGDAHAATLAAAAVPDGSRFYGDALLLLGRALDEAGESNDRKRAAEVLDLYLSRFGSRSEAPRARLLLGDILRSLDRHDDAALAYLELRDNHPLRSEAREAEEYLTQLSESVSTRLQARISERETPQRTLLRYRRLYERHRSDRVVDELPNHVDDYTAGSEQRCEVLFMIAHSHTKLRRHADGTPWYDRVLEECPDTSWEIRSLYLGGRGRWNAGDRDGAMEIFERIWTEYEDHSFADDAMYFTGRILRSQKKHDEAQQILKRQVERYPDGDMAKDAHWLLVRRHFDERDYDAVVDYVDGLDDTGEDDLYTRGRLAYFRARALEMAGRDAEAARGFRQVARDVPMSYYALLAINRLGRLTGSPSTDLCDAVDICDELLATDRNREPISVPQSLRNDAAFERGALLLSLGLNSHARAEFRSLRNRHAGSHSTLWALAMLLDRADAHPLSHDIARRHIDGWMDSYPDSSTRSRWEIAYPTPFREEVTRHARHFDVDIALVYAIMREESGFNPRIDSWANARGLLQLIEDTAHRMTTRTTITPYSFARLYEPDVNLHLGTAYMDYLGERLAGHPALVMASYNAGSGAVLNWLGDNGNSPLDLFVEDIPYGQTRRYTKRVLMSYWIYTYLYGDVRVPHLAFELPS